MFIMFHFPKDGHICLLIHHRAQAQLSQAYFLELRLSSSVIANGIPSRSLKLHLTVRPSCMSEALLAC